LLAKSIEKEVYKEDIVSGTNVGGAAGFFVGNEVLVGASVG
jgi:hypothetical protein